MLFAASERGDTEEVRRLLRTREPVTQDERAEALDISCVRGFPETARALLEGIEPEEARLLFEKCKFRGFVAACARSHVSVVRLVLNAVDNADALASYNDYHAIRVAVRNGHSAVVSIAAESVADRNALFFAANLADPQLRVAERSSFVDELKKFTKPPSDDVREAAASLNPPTCSL